ncbi:hypothetical protein [Pseudotabrizicola sp.]|uniref:hypothetical protein n=1 Tax=Pseudotabrizicola sp. TaxID=2939647 RepID=UPI00272FC766|nr:hypothetical protein [Pseudotabrizicola sp.]MDP2081911.1 hypothetical protein [Pseudotabrizicola sp.]
MTAERLFWKLHVGRPVFDNCLPSADGKSWVWLFEATPEGWTELKDYSVRDAEAYDFFCAVSENWLRFGVNIPAPVLQFSADIIAGKIECPKKRTRRYDTERNILITRLVHHVSEKTGLHKTHNAEKSQNSAARPSACEIVAKASERSALEYSEATGKRPSFRLSSNDVRSIVVNRRIAEEFRKVKSLMDGHLLNNQ